MPMLNVIGEAKGVETGGAGEFIAPELFFKPGASNVNCPPPSVLFNERKTETLTQLLVIDNLCSSHDP